MMRALGVPRALVFLASTSVTTLLTCVACRSPWLRGLLLRSLLLGILGLVLVFLVLFVFARWDSVVGLRFLLVLVCDLVGLVRSLRNAFQLVLDCAHSEDRANRWVVMPLGQRIPGI